MDLAKSNPISPHALPHLSGSNDFDGADSEWSGGTAPANRLALRIVCHAAYVWYV